jgi:hypothetical protein
MTQVKTKVKTNEPRSGDKQRRTTLSLTPELWNELKSIEDETGAKPSVTVRRALRWALDVRKELMSRPVLTHPSLPE